MNRESGLGVYLTNLAFVASGNLLAYAGAVAIAAIADQPKSWNPIVVGGALILLDFSLLSIPKGALFVRLEWNWHGKTLSALWPLLFVAVYPHLTFESAGIAGPVNSAWIPALVAGVIIVCGLNVVSIARGNRLRSSPETVAYQLFLPGLSEELVYRGVLLALLDQAFERPWEVLGAPVGWGLVITTVVFVATHVISVQRGRFDVKFDPEMLTAITVAGLTLGWMRERTASIWPGVIVHNASNATAAIAALFSP